MYFKPKRLHLENDDIKAVVSFLIESFAYMEGRIDPPSSLNAFKLETISDNCKSEEVWICAGPFGLYFSHAKTRAEVQGYKELKLQTRVELTENQRFFIRLGYEKTAKNPPWWIDHNYLHYDGKNNQEQR